MEALTSQFSWLLYAHKYTDQNTLSILEYKCLFWQNGLMHKSNNVDFRTCTPSGLPKYMSSKINDLWCLNPTFWDRPGRRIVDNFRLQRLLQPSEKVVKKIVPMVASKKT